MIWTTCSSIGNLTPSTLCSDPVSSPGPQWKCICAKTYWPLKGPSRRYDLLLSHLPPTFTVCPVLVMTSLLGGFP